MRFDAAIDMAGNNQTGLHQNNTLGSCSSNGTLLQRLKFAWFLQCSMDSAHRSTAHATIGLTLPLGKRNTQWMPPLQFASFLPVTATLDDTRNNRIISAAWF
jgi:hypothetical protein